MLSENQKQFFDTNGYLLIPGILSAEEVAKLRDFFKPKFIPEPSKLYEGDADDALFDIFSRYPEARWLLFHQPTIEVLRSLLGDDYVVLRETSVHFNRFGGWHKDTTSQEKAGHMFHWDDDFLMVEVAYYLQDNGEEYGGGLDVEPRSHKTPDPFKKAPGTLDRIYRKFNRVIGRPDGDSHRVKNFVSIPGKAGDLLIFHFRINHRATQKRQTVLPDRREKLAIFFACSVNNAHVQAYHNFIHSRPDYVYLKNFSYPDELIQESKAVGVNLV